MRLSNCHRAMNIAEALKLAFVKVDKQVKAFVPSKGWTWKDT
jgi:hypothetical protein